MLHRCIIVMHTILYVPWLVKQIWPHLRDTRSRRLPPSLGTAHSEFRDFLVFLASKQRLPTPYIPSFLFTRSYAQHDVTLQGSVMQVRKTEPYSCSKTFCGPATVAYSFTLQDDTAAIDVIVPCSCFGQMSITDGERVTAIVSIRIIEKDGLQSPAVVGVAHDIRASGP